MDSTFEIEFSFRNKRYTRAVAGLDAVATRFGKDIQKSYVELKQELRIFLDSVAEDLARRHGRAWPKGTSATRMSRRSGEGIKSIRKSVRVSGTKLENVEGHIGGLARLRIHEYGGTVRAKRAKYLTIPLPAALKSDGTPKKRSARSWTRTFVATSKKGNLIIFRKEGRKIVPLYLLKRSVKIPARLGMRATLERRLPAFIDRAVVRMLRGTLARA